MKRIIVSIFCVAAAVGLAVAVPSFAQTGTPITVYPAIQEKTIEPGVKTRLQVQFKNSGTNLVYGKVKVADFVINDKEGTPILVENEITRPKYSAAAWITPSQDQITIPANDYVSVDLYVNPPRVINTCGRYAMVYFELDPSFTPTQSTDRNSATAITQKIGALLNFTVDGQKCKENLQVSAFTTPSFLEYGPIPVTFDLLNMGDIHVTPQGVLSLSNMVNQTDTQQSIAEKSIFPETAKEYTAAIGYKWMIGRYRVGLLVSNPAKGDPILVSAYVWVLPWRVIVFILLALLLIGIAVRHFYGNTLKKEQILQKELKREQDEIAALKEMMRKRDE